MAEALADGSDSERQKELFRRARKADPTYGTEPCEQGVRLERMARHPEAAASFRACLENDPQQGYAHVGYVRNLVRARGKEAYVEARTVLRKFLEHASEEADGRGEIEDWVSDLEDLLEAQNPHAETERYSADQILRLLLRDPVRGSSRYDGPRVPLRLNFRPGDASLGTAAEEQLREVARALRDGSLTGVRVQLEGHTDSVEGKTRTAREGIARRRAETAKEFLVRCCGAAADSLRVAAFADDYPLEPNETDEGRAANRRVELVNLTTQEKVRGDVRDGS